MGHKHCACSPVGVCPLLPFSSAHHHVGNPVLTQAFKDSEADIMASMSHLKINVIREAGVKVWWPGRSYIRVLLTGRDLAQVFVKQLDTAIGDMMSSLFSGVG